ncbi:hypothetical protein PV779_17350 [Streptomyces sp. ID01-9D]|nr:hypothetical protein [Streptomyces sp. ID01-9D]
MMNRSFAVVMYGSPQRHRQSGAPPSAPAGSRFGGEATATTSIAPARPTASAAAEPEPKKSMAADRSEP